MQAEEPHGAIPDEELWHSDPCIDPWLSPHYNLGELHGQNGALLNPQPRTLLNGSAGSCSISQVNLRITTGKDDLRGGKNNLDVEVHLANGDMQTVPNVKKSSKRPNDSVRIVSISLNHPVAPDQIRQIRLFHSA